jgi:PAS domain S-box-containing protein
VALSKTDSGIIAASELPEGGLGTIVLDILDALPFYVLLVDDRHRILLANHAVRAAIDLEPSQIMGAFCPKVIHGQDAPFEGCPLEVAVVSGQPEVRELFDGKSGRWLESAIYPTRHRTAEGRRVFFHLVRDIGDRKRAEEERRALAAKLEEALAKVISGFVPICASCRRIRDDQGAWSPVESYIAGRTGAEFTHGLCPTCAAKLYGVDPEGKK